MRKPRALIDSQVTLSARYMLPPLTQRNPIRTSNTSVWPMSLLILEIDASRGCTEYKRNAPPSTSNDLSQTYNNNNI